MGMFSWLGQDSSKSGETLQQMRNAQAIDASTSCIMMADAERNIIYANKAVKTLLKEAEPELKKVLPQFSADNLIGQNIDQFHKNPSHQRGILANLTEQMTSSIVIGNLNFKLTLSPLRDQQGNNIGTVVEWVDQSELLLKAGMLDALSRSQAVIEFDPQGNIVDANENFLNAMGYRLEQIQGNHHRMFVDEEYGRSGEYKQFWEDLRKGEFKSGEFKRQTKSGEEIWIQASYNPIYDTAGNVSKVVKYATDITEAKLQNAYYQGQIEAIGKSQAVIEFELDGKIITANDNFLNAMGYSLDEIKGKHHSLFVEPEYKVSPEYRTFWDQLGSGQHMAGEYKRLAKGGREVWIQATYNPIFDSSGRPFRVVKYATDITSRKVAINDIQAVMMELSQGNLQVSLQEEKLGDFKELGVSINGFIEELKDTITQIRSAVETITGASSEIASGNADLSSRTEQQASSLEETASSMEELTSTVKLNAENADQASSLASQASTVAVDGGKLIGEVVNTMSSINDSAQKISDIIGVIDGIAFQTNILALNAAVEAARAGEQGRGFAVVASEVRTLAQRSAEAAKDIKELISDSVGKISNGNELVGKSGDTMQEVVDAIKRVNDIMSEIAAASAEQSSGIEEISKAVNQMDEMTQQNAALVEQAAAAAESMNSQADQLSERVSQFQVGVESQPSRSAARTAKAPVAGTSRKADKANGRQSLPKAAASDDDDWESF